MKSMGVTMALPWLECMSWGANKPVARKRFFGGFFAYGVPMPGDDAPDRLENGWFPVGTGKNYVAPEMHKSIMPMRDKITLSLIHI